MAASKATLSDRFQQLTFLSFPTRNRRASGQTETSAFRFLDLPGEFRNEVYDWLLLYEREISRAELLAGRIKKPSKPKWRGKKRPNPLATVPSIALVNHQISNEYIYRARNGPLAIQTFEVNSSGWLNFFHGREPLKRILDVRQHCHFAVEPRPMCLDLSKPREDNLLALQYWRALPGIVENNLRGLREATLSLKAQNPSAVSRGDWRTVAKLMRVPALTAVDLDMSAGYQSIFGLIVMLRRSSIGEWEWLCVRCHIHGVFTEIRTVRLGAGEEGQAVEVWDYGKCAVCGYNYVPNGLLSVVGLLDASGKAVKIPGLSLDQLMGASRSGTAGTHPLLHTSADG